MQLYYPVVLILCQSKWKYELCLVWYVTMKPWASARLHLLGNSDLWQERLCLACMSCQKSLGLQYLFPHAKVCAFFVVSKCWEPLANRHHSPPRYSKTSKFPQPVSTCYSIVEGFISPVQRMKTERFAMSWWYWYFLIGNMDTGYLHNVFQNYQGPKYVF